MANSSGQVPTDKINEAAVGPTAKEVATTSTFMPMPRPNSLLG